MTRAFTIWLPGLLCLLVTQPLLAQSDPVPTSTTTTTTSGGAQQDDAARRQQISEGQAIVSRGERLATQIGALKGQAEREQDIIRVTCLNTKLSEVNANLRSAKERLDKLRAESDAQRRTQLLTVLVVLGQKFDVLDQEANQCIGQNLFNTGQTKVDTTINNNLVPTEDEAGSTTVPTVVPPAETGQVELTTPTPTQEVSGDGNES